MLAEIDTGRQHPPPPPQVERPGLRERARSVVVGAAAAALIVIVALTVVVARMNARVSHLEARNAEIYEILAAEDARVVSVAGHGGARARFTSHRSRIAP